MFWFFKPQPHELGLNLSLVGLGLCLGLVGWVLASCRVARFRQGKYGRFKEDGNFHAKWHRVSLKKLCRNTGDPVKYGRSGNLSLMGLGLSLSLGLVGHGLGLIGLWPR